MVVILWSRVPWVVLLHVSLTLHTPVVYCSYPDVEPFFQIFQKRLSDVEHAFLSCSPHPRSHGTLQSCQNKQPKSHVALLTSRVVCSFLGSISNLLISDNMQRSKFVHLISSNSGLKVFPWHVLIFQLENLLLLFVLDFSFLCSAVQRPWISSTQDSVAGHSTMIACIIYTKQLELTLLIVIGSMFGKRMYALFVSIWFTPCCCCSPCA